MTDKKHASIAAALAAAQMEMGKALKTSENPHFKSRYADLASVLDACLPALNAHGIAVIQPLEMSDLGHIVKTVFIHETGTLETPVPLLIGKNDMQGLGSAITYARRYGLMSLAGIAPEDDDGNAAAASAQKNPMGAALNDAWKQGVLDQLPENATADEKAHAFADAIYTDFAGKGARALENAWARHEKLIGQFQNRFPDLWEKCVDAYETRKNDLVEAAAAPPVE